MATLASFFLEQAQVVEFERNNSNVVYEIGSKMFTN